MHPRVWRLLLGVLVAVTSSRIAEAQPFAPPPPGQAIAPAVAPVPGGNTTTFGPNQGGGAQADFESLIDLIISTVAPDTWAETGGGQADVRPFPNGVFVDADGTLTRMKRTMSIRDIGLSQVVPPSKFVAGDPRRLAELRCVSLPRLEREMARRLQARESLDPAMLTLAGLERARYVIVFADSGDVVLAGPAGNWRGTDEGRIVSTRTGAPVVRLDDFLTLLRRGAQSAGSPFGCSITPRPEGLANTQTFLASHKDKPITVGRRDAWLADLRQSLGKQSIEVFGIDPTSRAAHVLVEADHHMKLIGMGLAEGVIGMESYLDTIKLDQNGNPPEMNVLRWWFALNYRGLCCSRDGTAFEILGEGAKVLSENELLTARGERVHTGASDELTQRFAHSFTANFAKLCQKYPVYGELRNIFDLALFVALLEQERLAERAGWTPELFVSSERLPVQQLHPPKHVESVVNYRVLNRRHFVAGVSGGVWCDVREVFKNDFETIPDSGADFDYVRQATPPEDSRTWWWDVR
jgi:hypothetical protein